ncbi:MAG: flippase-like domain-containing protein [Phaeodactylibacter sp.]|nr:flippase-like domain-containing protein [Phaeodactylibacter sp.]
MLFTIYEQSFGRQGAEELWRAWGRQLEQGQWFWLAMVVLLLPANWCLEAQKWRYLLSPFHRLPFGQAFRAVIIGVSVSLFTPNRVGEYAGRVLAVPAPLRPKAMVAMAGGSLAQLLVILSVGVVEATFFLGALPGGIKQNAVIWTGAAVVVVAVLFAFFFNLRRIPRLAQRLGMPKRVLRSLLLLRRYGRGLLARALLLATLRYSVYSLQYFGLLAFFGVYIPPIAAFAGIGTIFLVQTSVPLPPTLALLVRGETALFLWSAYSPHKGGILAATFALFIINLCLPALLGLIFIVKTNVLKSLGYENDVVQNEPVKCCTDLSHGFHTPRKAGMG